MTAKELSDRQRDDRAHALAQAFAAAAAPGVTGFGVITGGPWKQPAAGRYAFALRTDDGANVRVTVEVESA